MEDTLRVDTIHFINHFNYVLILVLMEDTLRGMVKRKIDGCKTSLNPCFNGRYSQRVRLVPSPG